MLVSERELSQTVYEMATALGWKCYRTWLSLHSAAGFPDLVAVHPGQKRVLYSEFKREGAKPRANQQAWLDALREAGQEVYLWRPSDLLNGTIEAVLRADCTTGAFAFQDATTSTMDG